MAYRKLWKYQTEYADSVIISGRQRNRLIMKQGNRKTTEILHQTRTSKSWKKWDV